MFRLVVAGLCVVLLGLPVSSQSIFTRVSSGTGFIISSEGYLLTNEHIVTGAAEIFVMIGTRKYRATVVETLPSNDLALLKIDARNFSPVALGNSDSLEIGDEVYAIGCPGGVCGTVTVGRVANLNVNLRTEEGKVLQGVIMVDITITHGSSGSPLVNSKGEVIGITTAGEKGGFGFAIPINQAVPLLRRVPGFDVTHMRRATRHMSLREIRAQCTPGVVYVESWTEIPLVTLLPKEIPGYDQPAVVSTSLPSRLDRLCGDQVKDSAVQGARHRDKPFVVYIASASVLSEQQANQIVNDVLNAPATEDFRKAIEEESAFLSPLLLDLFPSLLDASQLAAGILSVKGVQVPYVVTLRTGTTPPAFVKRFFDDFLEMIEPPRRYAKLVGTAVLPISNVVIGVSLIWSVSFGIGPRDPPPFCSPPFRLFLPLPGMTEEEAKRDFERRVRSDRTFGTQKEYVYSDGCVRYQEKVQECAWRVTGWSRECVWDCKGGTHWQPIFTKTSEKITVLKTETLMCINSFKAELERVFMIALNALVAGLK